MQTPFFRNFYCIIPNTNIAFVAISKNAVTFLKKVAVYNTDEMWIKNANISQSAVRKIQEANNRLWLPGFQKVHDFIGYDENSPYLYTAEQLKHYEQQNGKLVKIAVWRDPVKRLESTYKLFCLEKAPRNVFAMIGLQNDFGFDTFKKFVEFEWTKRASPEWQDEHIRSMSDYFNKNDVDFIIPVEKIQHFLDESGIPYVKEQSNKTNVDFNISDEDFLEKIKVYYEEDYLLPINY